MANIALEVWYILIALVTQLYTIPKLLKYLWLSIMQIKSEQCSINFGAVVSEMLYKQTRW